VATDYGRWRIAQKTAISQLESSADFRNQQADAKAAFEQATAQAAQAGGDELKQQMQMLQHICEVSLVEQFRFGTPVSEANPRGASAAVELIRPAAATVQTGSVTVHKTTAPTAGGMLSHP
jgi:hypothetical protein